MEGFDIGRFRDLMSNPNPRQWVCSSNRTHTDKWWNALELVTSRMPSCPDSKQAMFTWVSEVTDKMWKVHPYRLTGVKCPCCDEINENTLNCCGMCGSNMFIKRGKK